MPASKWRGQCTLSIVGAFDQLMCAMWQVIRMVGESQETVSVGGGSGSSSNKMPTLEEYGTNLTTQATEVSNWIEPFYVFCANRNLALSAASITVTYTFATPLIAGRCASQRPAPLLMMGKPQQSKAPRKSALLRHFAGSSSPWWGATLKADTLLCRASWTLWWAGRQRLSA